MATLSMRLNMNIKKVLLLLVVVGICVYSGFWVAVCINRNYRSKILWTKRSLQALRHNVTIYKKENDQYPKSLSYLRHYIDTSSNTEYSKYHYKEYIKNSEGIDNVANVLNNKGGWYYNASTGEVKINVTDSLAKRYILYYIHYIK